MRPLYVITFAIFAWMGESALSATTSPGDYALQYQKKHRLHVATSAAVVDAEVETSPPDTTRIDRRLIGMFGAGIEGPFAGRFGYRLIVAATATKKRETDDMEPVTLTDTNETVLAPLSSITFITDQGLELFAGLGMANYQKKKQQTASVIGRSEKEYGTASVESKHFGVIRRAGGAWAGGFYYVMGDEDDRTVSTTAFDGSVLDSSEAVFIPSRFGVLGEFGAYLFAFDFIQARGFGPNDDSGRTIMGDYFSARLGYKLPIGLEAEVYHQTLGYDSNAYVTLDTIPITQIKLSTVTEGATEERIGLGVTYGRDGQSLPEFNAAYMLKAVTLSYSGYYDL